MKFYESGDNRKPVIFYFPVPVASIVALIMYWIIHSYFYTVAVSYDGFDSNEKTEFYSMEDECEKLSRKSEQSMVETKAAYGCSLGGSFVSSIQRKESI